MDDLNLNCWYLTGPTASGKTRVGLELARRLDAEIISLDSMAVYRMMDIGTAKPTPEERAAVPHHLIDIRDPNEDFSVSQYLETAREKIAEIRDLGREVLFVGGTPLYLKAMLRGLFDGPQADWEFRRQVRRELEEVSVETLHARLRQVDPLAAARLHPNDVRRIIRALEVYKLTGRPISHQQTEFDEARTPERCRVFVLAWPRNELHGRINRRVDEMLAAGWVDEVRAILDQFGPLGRTAAQAVGYREILEYMEGLRDWPGTVERIKARTRQFAKRQETWFRSLQECRPVEYSSEATPEEMAERIFRMGRGE